MASLTVMVPTFMVMMMMSALMVVVMAVTFVVTATTTAAFSAQSVSHSLNFTVGCFTAFYHLSVKAKRLACQRMVEIHLHFLVVQIKHPSEEVIAIFVLQWNNSVLKYMLVVEMTVDTEHLASRSNTCAGSTSP